MNLSEEDEEKNEEQCSYVFSFLELLFTICGLHCVTINALGQYWPELHTVLTDTVNHYF